MITPTVGRIVYFRPGINDAWMEQDYEFAAIIAKVNSNGTLNLNVIDGSGRCNPRCNIPLIQGALVADPSRAYCTWMKYQRGQAAKSDELLAALTSRIEKLEACEAARVTAFESVYPPRLIQAE